jgi:hypothetical protein
MIYQQLEGFFSDSLRVLGVSQKSQLTIGLKKKTATGVKNIFRGHV